MARILREKLDALGVHRVRSIEHFPVLGSTNEHLKDAARQGASEWSVVLADRQTAGRGRHGREWISGPGDLCLSVLLRPQAAPETLSLLPLAAGLAVADALAGLGLSARLKWPNDVLVGDRKIAGVLAEGLSTGGRLDAVVLGAGVNVRLDPALLPPDVAEQTTGLEREIGRRIEVVDVAAAVVACLAVWYDSLERGAAASVVAAWRSRALPWWGRPVEVVSGGEAVRGVARDVDSRGALVLETRDGLVAVLSGEARSLRIQ